MRFELTTSSLPRKRSTPELRRRNKKSHTILDVIFLSGRRGSNSRHSAWKADALPTELLPQFLFSKNFVGKRFANLTIILKSTNLFHKKVGRAGFEPTKPKQLSYSQSHLTALESPQFYKMSLLRDSNPRPRDYKSRALAN